MDLPVDPSSRAQSKRRTLLRLGEQLGWWTYESENLPGHVDRLGYEYPGVTYTIVRPGDGSTAERERVLLDEEVIGYVLGVADTRGLVTRIAFREGLLR
ncbi:hypothetical protein AB0A95_33390 [Micromonospora sp. NPDC049230]|uniref:hypothetical protein n=1 Tax=Micromonospora sp. NPDC049230 TaxID=3155502 RepID=UPI0033E8F437